MNMDSLLAGYTGATYSAACFVSRNRKIGLIKHKSTSMNGNQPGWWWVGGNANVCRGSHDSSLGDAACVAYSGLSVSQ